MKKIKLNISGMTCNNCANRVETALSELEGVEKVKINLKKETAKIKYDETIQDRDNFQEAVEEVGYQAELA